MRSCVRKYSSCMFCGKSCIHHTGFLMRGISIRPVKTIANRIVVIMNLERIICHYFDLYVFTTSM